MDSWLRSWFDDDHGAEAGGLVDFAFDQDVDGAGGFAGLERGNERGAGGRGFFGDELVVDPNLGLAGDRLKAELSAGVALGGVGLERRAINHERTFGELLELAGVDRSPGV